MEIIKGTLKELNTNNIYADVECEFEMDIFGGIKTGAFLHFYDRVADIRILLGKYFYFKNKEFIFSIYVNEINDYDICFRCIRFKRTYGVDLNKDLRFLTTKTELFFHQKLILKNQNIFLDKYRECGAIEFEESKDFNINNLNKLKNITENILVYIQLTQIHYCKILGYEWKNFLYIDYMMHNHSGFINRDSDSLNVENAQLFINNLFDSPFNEYLAQIINRLLTAKSSDIIQINCVWLIFALEALESVYNMKKDKNIKTNGNHIYFNEIVDELYPECDIIKVYFKNRTYWKPLLWVNRDKYVHFLRNVDDLNTRPDKGQEEKLDIIFNNNYKILRAEFKKLLPIAQRIICYILDIDYDKNFLKIF